MNIVEVIKQRRAIRHYTSRALDEKMVEIILEAGQYAPSPLNSQPWHFTLVRNKKSLKALAQEARHANFLSTAQLLIVVTVNSAIDIDPWLVQHHQHLYSGAVAMQNMWLTAEVLDVGCCWTTLDEAFTKKLLSIPKEHAIIGGLSLGYPVESPKIHMPEDRKTLSLLVSLEQFNSR